MKYILIVSTLTWTTTYPMANKEVCMAAAYNINNLSQSHKAECKEANPK